MSQPCQTHVGFCKLYSCMFLFCDPLKRVVSVLEVDPCNLGFSAQKPSVKLFVEYVRDSLCLLRSRVTMLENKIQGEV